MGVIPGGQVVGGSARDCKRFDTQAEAGNYFGQRAARGTRCLLFEYND